MVKRLTALTLAFPVMALAACSEDNASSSTEMVMEDPSMNLAEPEEVELSEQDRIRVCRGGQAFRVGRDPETIEAAPADDLVRLTYTRDDGRSFAYDCMIEGNALRYRMIDEGGPGTGPGAWSGRGSQTSFEILPEGIRYRDIFSDGSSDSTVLAI